MLNFLKYFLFTITWLIPFTGVAQDLQPWSGFGIETTAIAGKVIKHEAKFTLPIPPVTTSLDVNFLLQTYGRKEWEQRRRYPVIGLAFSYVDYGIDSIYGRCYGLYPNLTIPIISGKKLSWDIRLGDGIGYVTRDYHRTAPVDTINVAIGSHINDFGRIMTGLRYHINDHWDAQFDANITHISDGSFHKPNLGVNMIGAGVGVRYSPVTSRPLHVVRDLKPLKNRWLVEFRGTFAYVSSYTSGGPLYPVYLATGYVSRRWLSKNKFFGGIDYSYNENVYAYLRNNGLEPGHEAQHSYKSAIIAGNEFVLGRVGIVLQAGIYLKQAYIKMDPVYEKIGGNYYLVQKEHGPIKEFFLCAFVKSDLFDAELGEFGFGIGF